MDGGAPSAELAAHIRKLRNSPLDEGRGEGIHRATNNTKAKAASSSSAWTMSSARTTQSANDCKAFMKFGPQGVACVRYEWRNYTRLFQRRKSHMFRRTKMKKKHFIRKLFQLDPPDVDWKSVLKPAPKTPNDKLVGMPALQKEYIQATLEDKFIYSLPLHADDAEVGANESRFFQILAVQTPQTRPKYVRTVADETDVRYNSKLTLLLQNLGFGVKTLTTNIVCILTRMQNMWML